MRLCNLLLVFVSVSSVSCYRDQNASEKHPGSYDETHKNSAQTPKNSITKYVIVRNPSPSTKYVIPEQFKIFLNNNVSSAKLIDISKNLGPVVEPYDFWNECANNQLLEAEQRRICVYNLLHRHVDFGVDLKSFSKMTFNNRWLIDSEIIKCDIITGHIPIHYNLHDTVFELLILSHLDGKPLAVYIRVTGNVSLTTFVDAIRTNILDDTSSKIRIEEIGFSGLISSDI